MAFSFSIFSYRIQPIRGLNGAFMHLKYMCACMYMSAGVYMCIYLHICIYIYVYMYIYLYVCVYMSVFSDID